LGKAITSFHKGEYIKALEQYKRIIKNNPLCPFSIYNAAALCLYKIGNVNQAQLIYQKVLQKDSDNDNAMLGLAMIESNEDGAKYEQL
jgi:tetratricopeptide (TPR) repeat protein